MEYSQFCTDWVHYMNADLGDYIWEQKRTPGVEKPNGIDFDAMKFYYQVQIHFESSDSLFLTRYFRMFLF